MNQGDQEISNNIYLDCSIKHHVYYLLAGKIMFF